MSSGHHAVLLAAGAGRRLGRCKQTLTRQGEPLVHRAARLALATSPLRLHVVLGAHAAAVADAIGDLPCAHVFVGHDSGGLAASLRAAGAALHGFDGAVLVLGCDQPALELAHLHALLHGAACSGAAATLHDGRAGIPAVVPAGWFDTLAGQDDVGFGPRLRALEPAARYDLHAPALAFDVDTRSDLDAAVAAGWLDPA